MALRKIICIEDELLRKKSRPVEKFDEKLHKLLDDMAETMYNAREPAVPLRRHHGKRRQDDDEGNDRRRPAHGTAHAVDGKEL